MKHQEGDLQRKIVFMKPINDGHPISETCIFLNNLTFFFV